MNKVIYLLAPAFSVLCLVAEFGSVSAKPSKAERERGVTESIASVIQTGSCSTLGWTATSAGRVRLTASRAEAAVPGIHYDRALELLNTSANLRQLGQACCVAAGHDRFERFTNLRVYWDVPPGVNWNHATVIKASEMRCVGKPKTKWNR